MSEFKAGACALIVAAVAMIGVMGVHPSHIDQELLIGPVGLSTIVHGVAILAHVLLAYGAWTLSRFLGFDRAFPGLAFTFALLATVEMINAGIVSMFISPAAALATSTADPASQPLLIGQAHVWMAANRGFAQVDVALLSIALCLWGLAWPGKNMAMRLGGLVAGLPVLAWQLTGQFEPSTHTMPFIALLQGVWLVAAGREMLRGHPVALEVRS